MKTHGELWYKMKCDLQETRYLDLPKNYYAATLPNRDPVAHMVYYKLKFLAVQLDTFGAWEVFRTYCKLNGYRQHKKGD